MDGWMDGWTYLGDEYAPGCVQVFSFSVDGGDRGRAVVVSDDKSVALSFILLKRHLLKVNINTHVSSE